ncbi:DASH complex subunit Spc34 [Apiospora phragmitis]|uniref:DASH complex subunit SPC34 n=1 Tax=Apiospora phragmitis TaxID=2905665 RepID=A0ABR1TDR5_9PEZI
MSLLSAHFEQIAISCQGIDSLPFPPPKIFTNALLSNHDITSLIRDTEAHERALFSVPPPPPHQQPITQAAKPEQQQPPKPSSSRRQTVFNVASGERRPRRHTAVAAVLGGDLHDQIRRSERGLWSKKAENNTVDVELLLKSAEKLCGVYPLPGALERIPAQRSKYAHSLNTLAYYEAKVAEQAEALGRQHKDMWSDEEDDEEDAADPAVEGAIMTEEELRREEEEVQELDKKKRELQERLKAMEKDLGGLLNM